MTFDELRQLCKAPIDSTGEVPKHIYLTTIKDRMPGGDNIRLFTRSGPLGRICTIKEADDKFSVTACFQRAEILAALDKAEGK